MPIAYQVGYIFCSMYSIMTWVNEAPLPISPLNTSMGCHWLAIEGVLPDILENALVGGLFLLLK